jgi:hypothetical protein
VAKLAPYLRSAGVWKCPSDRSTWKDLSGASHPRVRSYSVNEVVGTLVQEVAPVYDGTLGPFPTGWWLTYGKVCDMARPGPANLFIIAQQDQFSIHDAGFGVNMQVGPTRMFDWPATVHNYGCMFAFGDAHTEIHKWRDLRTGESWKYPFPTSVLTPQGNPDNPDILWMQERTTVRAQ